MNTIFYRSESDRMLGGVCGGLATYLGIDATLVRLFFVILFFGTGVGILAYLALWIIAPSESTINKELTWKESLQESGENLGERINNVGSDFTAAMRQPNPKAGVIIGGALIALGGLLFIENLGIPGLGWLNFDVLWPVLLIIAGTVMLARRSQEGGINE